MRRIDVRESQSLAGAARHQAAIVDWGAIRAVDVVAPGCREIRHDLDRMMIPIKLAGRWQRADWRDCAQKERDREEQHRFLAAKDSCKASHTLRLPVVVLIIIVRGRTSL